MTNNQLILALRQAVKDTNATRPARTDAVLGSILTLAQGFLNRELELCRKAFTLTLVADTREYQADATFIQFVADRVRKNGGCVYWSGGNLAPDDTARLDAEEPGWRALESGTPAKFYLEVGMSGTDSVLMIGLNRAPDADFVADVPELTYYGLVRPAAIAANDNYPFDNNRLYEDLDNLLIQWSIAEIDRQDGNHEKAAASMEKLISYLDVARTWIPGKVRTGGGFKFAADWRS